MELTQRYNYGVIGVYKNYSYFGENRLITLTGSNSSKPHYLSTPNPNKKSQKHYDFNDPIVLSKYGDISTDDDVKIKKYYNTPFSSIGVITQVRSLRVEGDKIKIKYYIKRRIRNVNNKYFRTSVNSTTITFNTNNGNFIITKYTQSKRSKTQSFRCNYFFELVENLGLIIESSRHVPNKKTKNVYKRYTQSFDDKKFLMKLSELLGLKRTPENYTDFYKLWLYRFVELKKIKIPDTNIESYLIKHYPTEKYLKKNDRKLILSILDLYKIRSNITSKILHINPRINIDKLVNLCKIFGDDFSKYIGNIPIKLVIYLCGEVSDDNIQNPNISVLSNKDFHFDENEKKSILKIFNDFDKKRNKDIIHDNQTMVWIDLIRYVYDHYDMMFRVRPYFPDIRLSSTTFQTFMDAHMILSKLQSKIQKGYEYELIYDEDFIKMIQTPIDVLINEPEKYVKTISFKPKVLLTDSEYEDEGSYMSHCVGGYITHTNSVIISLRCGDDRVTCEYDSKTKTCVQSRYFRNENPPEYFKSALNDLTNRIRTYPKSISPLERKEKKLSINGIEVNTNIMTNIWF